MKKIRVLLPTVILLIVSIPFSGAKSWELQGPITDSNDRLCILKHSDKLVFRISKSVDRLEVGFFSLPKSAFDDAKSPIFRINMRVDERYGYSGAGQIIDGASASWPISVTTSDQPDLIGPV